MQMQQLEQKFFLEYSTPQYNEFFYLDGVFIYKLSFVMTYEVLTIWINKQCGFQMNEII